MTEKELIKKLMERLWGKYDYASILKASSVGKNYSVSAGGITISQNDLWSQDGYVIKVVDKGVVCEYSFNVLSEDELSEIEKAVGELLECRRNLSETFGVNNYEAPDEEVVKSFTENEVTDSPIECPDDEIIDRLKDLREYALSLDERLLDCKTVVQYQEYEKYFLSPKKELSQKVLWTCSFFVLFAKKGDVVRNVYKAFSNRDGMKVLDKMKEKVAPAVKDVIDLLDAESITPGEYECVCTPEVTGMIVHEAFGHGVEMDMFVKNRALAKDYIGKQVASPLVTMHDGAAAAVEVATYDFDDEGTPATDTVVIDKGILVSGICDNLSAQALGVKPTGNGRRESFERKAYTRMTNTFFEGGTDTVEDMIKSIKHGYLLSDPTCGMEDPKNWGIQCMVNSAREIVDGKLTGKIYSPIILSGYVPDLLKSISMMSSNVELCGSGACGKGYKEFVKVSDGGPYIKAKVKIG